MRRRINPWIGLSTDAWLLGMESASVIALRTLKMAAGGSAAATEANLMVSEKLSAGFELQAKAMTGNLGSSPASAAAKTLSHYRRKVKANRRRLAKA